MRSLIILMLLWTSVASAKTISYFRCVLENGEMVLSDRPCAEDAENLNLTIPNAPPPAVVEAPPVAERSLPDNATSVPVTPAPTAQGEAEPANPYVRLGVLSPMNGEALRSEFGSVSVAVTSTPGLQPGHQFQYLIDGKELARSDSNRITLNGLNSGRRALVVNILDEQGRIIIQTQVIYFILF